jgi:hypothetical protein
VNKIKTVIMKKDKRSKTARQQRQDVESVKGKPGATLSNEKNYDELGTMKIGKAHSMKDDDVSIKLKEKKK